MAEGLYQKKWAKVYEEAPHQEKASMDAAAAAGAGTAASARRAAGTVLARCEVPAFHRFGGAKDGDSEAAADFVFRSRVTCHVSSKSGLK